MDHNITEQYGDNKIVLMVRDPWTLFTYWETQRDIEDRIKKEIYEKGLTPSASILRVYEITADPSGESCKIVSDFELKNLESSWYIHSDPARKWFVEIGIRCTEGEFFCLARSNIVETPRDRMSDVYDDKWRNIYDNMFDISVGISSGMYSSTDLIRGRK